jgi:hypothetical protein
MLINIQNDCDFTGEPFFNPTLKKWFWALDGYDTTQDLILTINNRKPFDTKEECQTDLDDFMALNGLKKF